MTHTVGCLLLGAALVVLALALYKVYTCSVTATNGGDKAASTVLAEEFTNVNNSTSPSSPVKRHSWGYDGQEFAQFEAEHTPQVRGPEPSNPELYTWQYHPQNTLVDYRFYLAPECTAAAEAHRMAPIADGRIGKTNMPPVRVQQLEGAADAYVYKSPASHVPLDHPTPEYEYSTPAAAAEAEYSDEE